MAKSRSAHLTHESSGGREGYRLRFYDRCDRRRSMWIGNVSEHDADGWRKHVEHLVDSSRTDEPPNPSTTRWLAALPLRSRAKLERVELVAQKEANREKKRKQDNAPPDRLGAFLDWYIANHTAKPRTIVKWKQGRDCLLRYFKANRKLDSITHADAASWRTWIAEFGNIREGKERTDKEGNKTQGRTDLADATVRRQTGQARQFFNFAIKARLVESNPFAALPATVHGNDDRQFFVSHDMVAQMLDKASGAEWEAIIALARFGGLRAPSEVMELTWEDIDFPNRRMRIFSPKLARNKHKGIRYCPIFPELLPYLESLSELAKHRGANQTDYIITAPRGSESVLRPGMLKILKLAGLEVYPKLFQNLRASRETELMDEFPIKDVCSWIGNSPKVAMEHYAMQRQGSFDRATGLGHGNGGPNGGPKTGDSRQLPATSESDPEPEPPPFDQGKPRANAPLATCGDSGQIGKGRPGRT
ncbi:MAG: site-specific integrase [Pirellulaceae bacterium]|nr:site-specific integrase [Pirellulaceae bacterium]